MIQVSHITARPFQERVINECSQAYRNGIRVICLESPTGSGKRYIAVFVSALTVNNGKSVWFIADRRILIQQMANTLNECGLDYGVLMDGYSYRRAPITLISKDTAVSRCETWLTKPDLIVIDEAHTAFGDEYRNLWMKQDCQKLLLTATPQFNGGGLGIPGGPEQIIKAATYAELIEAGLLVPCKVYSTDRAGELVGNVFTEWKRLGEGRQTVVFWPTVAESIAGAELFNGQGIPSSHIDGTTPQTDRDEFNQAIASGDITVGHSCGVLTTGWDCPPVSCAVFAFKTQSLIKFRQCAGRILRPSEGKTDAIIIDHGGNVHEHGWPTSDIIWPLEPKVSAEQENSEEWKRERKENPPVECARCGRVTPAKEYGKHGCPGCGHSFCKRRGSHAQHIDGILTELHEKKIRTPDESNWLRVIGLAIGMGRKQGRNVSMKQAVALYNKKYDKWPDESWRTCPRGEWRDKPAYEFYKEVVKGREV